MKEWVLVKIKSKGKCYETNGDLIIEMSTVVHKIEVDLRGCYCYSNEVI